MESETRAWRTEPRRVYSSEFKLRLVELATRPDANVADIARAHGVNDNVLFTDQIDMSALQSHHSDHCFKRMGLMTAYGAEFFSMNDVNRLRIL